MRYRASVVSSRYDEGSALIIAVHSMYYILMIDFKSVIFLAARLILEMYIPGQIFEMPS